MGKGDKKTRRGKIWLGSFGNTRKRKVNVAYLPKTTVEEKAVEPTTKPKVKKVPKKKPRTTSSSSKK